MTCPDAETLLAFIEDRLAAQQRQELDAHLGLCSICRALVLQLAPPVPPGPDTPTLPSQPRTAAPSRLVPGTRIGRYEITRFIGQGGMGLVYAARDSQLDREVALKLIRRSAAGPDPDAQLEARLVREAHAMARIAHPNVTAVHDVGWHDDQVFVAMELVHGETLDAWLRRPRSQREIVDVFIHAGRGLGAVHAAGLVHRDFKPHNLMLDDNGRVRVMDFGLARVAGAAEAVRPGDDAPPLVNAVTAAGALVGTPAYMAPEQLACSDTDARTDQFSFCVALYEALAGVRPFAGRNVDELRRSIAAGRLSRPQKRVPRAIRRVVERGLRADRDTRWPSMDALVDALARARQRPAIVLTVTVSLLVVGALALLATRRMPHAAHHVVPVQRKLTMVGNVSDAVIAPDGKQVAYLAGSKIWLRDVGSERARVIAEGRGIRRLMFTADGSALFFQRLGDARMEMMRVPRDGGPAERAPQFDWQQLDVSIAGEVALTVPQRREVRIDDLAGKELRRIEIDPRVTWLRDAAWSPDGDRLLVSADAPGHRSFWIYSRDGKRQGSWTADGGTFLDWFDAETLIAIREASGGGDDLYVQPLDGSRFAPAGEPRPIVPGLPATNLSSTRRGDILSYVKSDTGDSAVWIVTVEDDGKTATRRLPLGTAMVCGARISPDGSRVGVTISDGRRNHLAVVPVAGGEPRSLAELPRCAPAGWSPDGSQLAWREDAQVAFMPASGGPVRRWPATSASTGDYTVAWLDRDRVLYHVEGHKQWNALDVRSGAIAPFLKDDSGWYFSPTLSPDGRSVAVDWNRNRRTGTAGVWIIGLDGREQLVSSVGWLSIVGWSGDGQTVYTVERDSDHPFVIGRVPRSGGKPTPWATMPISTRGGCTFARDGRTAVCLEQLVRSDVWLIENFRELVEAAR